MNTQICPTCGEQNPSEAIMCWNCYTPLGVEDTSNQSVARRSKASSKNIAPYFMLLGGGGLVCYGLAQRKRQSLLAVILGSGLAYISARQLQNQSCTLIGEAERRFDANEDITTNQTIDVPPIIRIANAILTYAVKDKASEIHIEPQQKGLRILYLVDGVLHEQMKVPTYILEPLAQRFKVMSAMDLRARRARQTGHLKFRMGDQSYAASISFAPSIFGNKISLRFE